MGYKVAIVRKTQNKLYNYNIHYKVTFMRNKVIILRYEVTIMTNKVTAVR